MSPIIQKLIKGFTHFRERYFSERQSLYASLVKDGQKPKVAVIACADSRVDPAIVLQVEPGEIFAVRNVANLVPPYETDDNESYHGTSAAIEFAVTKLDVDHIVVFGHAHCAGIQNMIDAQEGVPQQGHFVQQWTSIAAKAYDRAQAEKPGAKGEDLARCCEKQAVLVSLENLRTFPFIKDRLDAGTLEIHGWYLDIAKGELSSYDPEAMTFQPLK